MGFACCRAKLQGYRFFSIYSSIASGIIIEANKKLKLPHYATWMGQTLNLSDANDNKRVVLFVRISK
jgi:hypothetical protein